MSYAIENLLEGRNKPVCVAPQTLVKDALNLMIEHDFSQLPVIDTAQKPLGMITSDSIIRAMYNFKIGINALHAADALIKAEIFYPEDDLFDVLDRLKTSAAILVVNDSGELIGIITSYDSSEYFRQRAEDLMWIEDIERNLKDYISLPYTDENGDVDDEALSAAIAAATSSKSQIKQQVNSTILHYFNHQQSQSGRVAIDSSLLDQIIDRHFPDNRLPGSLEDLTMNQLITIFLQDSQWKHYQHVFAVDKAHVRQLLDGVRETRNALAHFRGEITPLQRDQLRYCAQWLGQHQEALTRQISKVEAQTDTVITEDSNQIPEERQTSVESEIRGENRYARLREFLANQPEEREIVTLKFREIEEIIGGKLPASAYKHRAWWANDSLNHVQSREWLNAGWRASVTISNETVTFKRIRGRELAYNHFFNQLLNALRESGYDENLPTPRSNNEQFVGYIPRRGKKKADIHCQFGWNNRFNISLTIDNGNAEINKHIFDELYKHNNEIEDEIGHKLKWKRLDNHQLSRVNLVLSGAIDDTPEKLAELRQQVVKWLPVFRDVFEEQLNKIEFD